MPNIIAGIPIGINIRYMLAVGSNIIYPNTTALMAPEAPRL
jgi:hypothetical protein